MIVQTQPPLHLTYCLNIHKGETLAEVQTAIAGPAARVKDAIAPDRPMGLGLRLGQKAAAELRTPQQRELLRNFLTAHGFYVFTINGFPYGQFHHTEVKEKVYAPDWRYPERQTYTVLLAQILAHLLPHDVDGSISTVPGSCKTWIQSQADVENMLQHFVETVASLVEIRQRTGRSIALALEPEPGCWLESSDDCIAFFGEELLPYGRTKLARQLRIGTEKAEQLLRRHLGICVDTCHLAVKHEMPEDGIRALLAAGIAIPKIQLSSALRFHGGPEALDLLQPFCEPTYLHQVSTASKRADSRTWLDLPEALADLRQNTETVDACVHFHVPLFWEGGDVLQSTAKQLTESFWELLRSGCTAHIEIETYTFEVLPPELANADVVDSIATEFRWVQQRLQQQTQ